MSGSVFKRCPHGGNCPELGKRRHGSWFWAVRVPTTGGRQLLRRGGFELQRDADAALRTVAELLALDPDPGMRERIGDMIAQATRRGGPLPDPAALRRRLGAGLDPAAPEVTTSQWAESWLAGKRRLKPSVARSYSQHIAHYITPLLGDVPLARLRAEHVAGMFDRIRQWNADIEEQRAAGRALIRLEGDVRDRPQPVNTATMHRIYATLRACLNAAVRQRVIPWNPCAGVELPAETRDPARVWGPAEVRAFLAATEASRLHALWRLVLLGGLRRGEVCGLRWQDIDLDGGRLRVAQTVLQLGGRVVIDTPKSVSSARVVSLDAETVRLLAERQREQRRERFAAGSAYEDAGLVFCDEIGRRYPPDRVSAWFRQAVRAAGLPVIKLHEGRHTAATLALEAGLDIKVVSDRLGHSTTRITADTYSHVRRVVADDAAATVAALVAGEAAR